MSTPCKTKRASGALLLALALAITTAGIGPAEPKSKAKKAGAGEPEVSFNSLNSPLSAPRPTGTTGASGPVRFFSINQVLAKLDSQQTALPVSRLAHNSNDAAPSVVDVPPRMGTPIGDEPFGLYTFRAPEGLLWVKWRKVEADIEADLAALAECPSSAERCAPATREFRDLVAAAAKRTGREKIDLVNRSVNNSIRYVSDLAQHGVSDLWSGPLSTYKSRQGDCEDYAIAKYVALREAGMSRDDLRLLLVRDRFAGDHAVVGARHEGRWLILDNRHSRLLEPDSVAHLRPMFALDHQGVKLFAAPYAQGLPAQHVPAPAVAENASPALAAAGSGSISQPLLL